VISQPPATSTRRDTAVALLRRHLRLLAVVLFLVVLAAWFELSGLTEHFDLAFMRQTILRHEAGGLVLFVLLFSLGNLVQIPGLLFLAAAVLTLGKIGGGIVTYVAVVSCGVTFVVIRFLGGDALRQLRNRVAKRILKELDRHPIGSVALLRLLLQTAPPVNYALALSGLKFRHYMLGTLIGLPLPLAVYCLFFEFLAERLHVG